MYVLAMSGSPGPPCDLQGQGRAGVVEGGAAMVVKQGLAITS
jgi:hypothetical protein